MLLFQLCPIHRWSDIMYTHGCHLTYDIAVYSFSISSCAWVLSQYPIGRIDRKYVQRSVHGFCNIFYEGVASTKWLIMQSEQYYACMHAQWLYNAVWYIT